jgi:hypothetical protein
MTYPFVLIPLSYKLALMVYTCVLVVRGFVVEKKELQEYLENNEVDLNFDDEDVWNDQAPFEAAEECLDKVEIFRFACCSPLSTKKWIIGYTVDTINRCEESEFCVECRPSDDVYPRDSLCDECIGKCSNGRVYDVVKIHENVVECDTNYTEDKLDLKKEDDVIEISKLYFGNKKLGMYYMIDDCLSCT